MENDIVISGIAGRYPQCENIDELKEKLLGHVDMVTVNELRWPYETNGLHKRSGRVENIEKFDASYFNITKDRVNMMDSQTRLLLELAFEAFIDSGKFN